MVSIQDLRPNSQDTSAFYLQNIVQLLANSSASLGGTIPSVQIQPPRFSPSTTAVWVNSLWFLSFAMSLTCAMLATLQLQWAHRYIEITHARHSPYKRARIREYFVEGLKRLRLPWMLEMLPTLLHISLFFFFAGLLAYLFPINLTVFNVVVWWIAQFGSIYAYVTLMPIFRHNSPYCTPLTSTVWFIYTSTLCISFKFLKSITSSSNQFSRATHRRYSALLDKYSKWLIHGVPKAAEESALKVSPELDGRALIWTLEASHEDDKLERFFASIPGFCGSKVVNDPLGLSIQPNRERLSSHLIDFICRTLSSTDVSDPVRMRRMRICAEVMEAASLPISQGIFDALRQRDSWEGLLRSVDFGLFLRSVNRKDPDTAYFSRLIISMIIANVQIHDARWFELTTGQLSIPDTVLGRYLCNGDSALLANCVHISRCIFRDHSLSQNAVGSDSLGATLKSVSGFAIQDTLPELRQEFCALWNEIVFNMRNNEDPPTQDDASITVLSHIRHLYLNLHQGTDSAPAYSTSTADHEDVLCQHSSYPLCDVPDHLPDSAGQVPKAGISKKTDASLVPSFSPYNNVARSTITPMSPDAEISSFQSPYATPYLANVRSPGNVSTTISQIPPITVSPHPVPFGNHLPSTTSVDTSSPGTTHGPVDTSVMSSITFPVPSIPYNSNRVPSQATHPPTLPNTLPPPTFVPSPSCPQSEDSPLHSNSAASRAGNVSHGPTSLPATSALSPTTSQVAPVLDPNTTSGSRTLSTHSNRRDVILPTQTCRPPQSELSILKEISKTSPPGSRSPSRESAKSPCNLKKS